MTNTFAGVAAGQGISLQRPSVYGIYGGGPVPFLDVRVCPLMPSTHLSLYCCLLALHHMGGGWQISILDVRTPCWQHRSAEEICPLASCMLWGRALAASAMHSSWYSISLDIWS